jgi:hypothetical protein
MLFSYELFSWFSEVAIECGVSTTYQATTVFSTDNIDRDVSGHAALCSLYLRRSSILSLIPAGVRLNGRHLVLLTSSVA